ncbi:L,D-transpeptidase family protein [Streptomyces sp. H10-C2]|uniref:L,D-transpeptidase family protein n=1 Tax=unclassified Streptomyces TaxID=2593676 RepID=UPI0024B87EAB|nr:MULTISPECIES: L,D-transpeptidase family protein [unclassified Streptomyces]MDJ0340511.1 L,D-transpeptidase family protein [Streptomyces sp. PH10-H1]MDJ0370159.1 L,D-transpeptidase family protein [Streptomyces sp. H10-C2]
MRTPITIVVAALAAAALAGCGPQGKPAADAKPSAGSSTTVSPSASATSTSSSTPKPPVVPAVMKTGSNGEQVRELQARLGQLNLFSRTPTGTYGSVTENAVNDFQERYNLPMTGSVSAETWSKLRGVTKQPTHAAMYPPTVEPAGAKLDPRCLTGHVLCISKTTRTLSWVIDGKVQTTLAVRFGSQYTPTREGQFKVDFTSRDHVSTIYHTSMPYAMFFSGGQAVHYSSDFAARGYAGASHGCVNVRDKAAIASLFDQVKAGDKVVVYW